MKSAVVDVMLVTNKNALSSAFCNINERVAWSRDGDVIAHDTVRIPNLT
jgi:hypothetical protein